MAHIRSCIAAGAGVCALGGLFANGAPPETLPVAAQAVRLQPLRLAAFHIDETGAAVIDGEWTNYDASVRGAPSQLAFDCFEPDSSGAPTDGRYGQDCGLNAGRLYFGPAYRNPYAVNDMFAALGTQGLLADRAAFAWSWQVTGPGSSERCMVAVSTAEDFDYSCAGPPFSGQYPGVLYDFGILQANQHNEYYYANVFIGGTPLRHQLPFDGAGAYAIFLARDQIFNQLVPATSAQPMLWSTKPGNPSQQGPPQWNDDNPPDGFHSPPFECAIMPPNCPGPLGAMLALYTPPTGNDCNGNLWSDGIDIGTGQSSDRNANGQPDECDIAVTIQQLNWSDNAGGYVGYHSDWGEFHIALDSTDAGLLYPHPGGGLYAWVNIRAWVEENGQVEWPVRNFLVYFENAAAMDTSLGHALWTDLGFPVASPVDRGLRLETTLLPEPYPDPPPPPTVFSYWINSVGERDVLFGGLIDPPNSGNSGNAPPPVPQQQGGSGTKVGKAHGIKDVGVGPVNEGPNGCVPGSVARSLHYLDTTSDAFSTGQSAQQIYDEIYGYMGTTAAGGTSFANMKKGKKKYADKHNLIIETTEAATYADAARAVDGTLANGDPNPAGRADVEMDIDWGNGFSHQVFVASMYELTNAAGNLVGWQVNAIDDGDQQDQTAESHVESYTVNADGTIAGHPNARITRFIVERAKPKPLEGGIPGVPGVPPIPGPAKK